MARGGPERLDAVGLVVGASPVGPGGYVDVWIVPLRTPEWGSFDRPGNRWRPPGNAPDDTGLGEDLRFADSRRRSRPAKENEPNGRWGVIDRLSASARAKQP